MAADIINLPVNVDIKSAQRLIDQFFNTTDEKIRKSLSNAIQNLTGKEIKQVVKLELKTNDKGIKEWVSSIAEAGRFTDELGRKQEQANKTQSGSVTNLRQIINQAKQARDEIARYNVSIDESGRKVKTLNSAWVEQNNKIKEATRSLQLASANNLFDKIKVQFNLGPLLAGGKVINELVNTFQSLSIIAGQALAPIGALAKALKNVQQVGLSFSSIGLDRADVSKAFADSSAIALKYGVNLNTVREGFQQLTPAVINAGGNIEDVSAITSALSSRFAALSLSADKSQRVMNGVIQAFGKGKLMSEELNQQIAEADPAFRGDLARAVGVSVSALNEMVKAGDLTSEVLIDVIPKLEKTSIFFGNLGASAQSAVKSLADGRSTIAQVENQIATLGQLNLEFFANQFKPLLGAFLQVQAATTDFITELRQLSSIKFIIETINSLAYQLTLLVTAFFEITKVVLKVVEPFFKFLDFINATGIASGLLAGIITGKLVLSLVGLGKTVLPLVIAKLKEFKAVTSSGLGDQLKKFADAGKQQISAPTIAKAPKAKGIEVPVTINTQALKGADQQVSGFTRTLGGNFQAAFLAISNGFNDLKAKTANFISSLRNVKVNSGSFQGLFSAVSNGFESLKQKTSTFISSLQNIRINSTTFQSLFQAIGTGFNSSKQKLTNFVTALGSIRINPSQFASFFNSFGASLNGAKQKFSQFLSNLKIPQLNFSQLFSGFGNAVNDIKTKITQALDFRNIKPPKIEKNILAGLLPEDFLKKAPQANSAITDLGKSATQASGGFRAAGVGMGIFKAAAAGLIPALRGAAAAIKVVLAELAPILIIMALVAAATELWSKSNEEASRTADSGKSALDAYRKALAEIKAGSGDAADGIKDFSEEIKSMPTENSTLFDWNAILSNDIKSATAEVKKQLKSVTIETEKTIQGLNSFDPATATAESAANMAAQVTANLTLVKEGLQSAIEARDRLKAKLGEKATAAQKIELINLNNEVSKFETLKQKLAELAKSKGIKIGVEFDANPDKVLNAIASVKEEASSLSEEARIQIAFNSQGGQEVADQVAGLQNLIKITKDRYGLVEIKFKIDKIGFETDLKAIEASLDNLEARASYIQSLYKIQSAGSDFNAQKDAEATERSVNALEKRKKIVEDEAAIREKAIDKEIERYKNAEGAEAIIARLESERQRNRESSEEKSKAIQQEIDRIRTEGEEKQAEYREAAKRIEASALEAAINGLDAKFKLEEQILELKLEQEAAEIRMAKLRAEEGKTQAAAAGIKLQQDADRLKAISDKDPSNTKKAQDYTQALAAVKVNKDLQNIYARQYDELSRQEEQLKRNGRTQRETLNLNQQATRNNMEADYVKLTGRTTDGRQVSSGASDSTQQVQALNQATKESAASAGNLGKAWDKASASIARASLPDPGGFNEFARSANRGVQELQNFNGALSENRKGIYAIERLANGDLRLYDDPNNGQAAFLTGMAYQLKNIEDGSKDAYKELSNIQNGWTSKSGKVKILPGGWIAAGKEGAVEFQKGWSQMYGLDPAKVTPESLGFTPEKEAQSRTEQNQSMKIARAESVQELNRSYEFQKTALNQVTNAQEAYNQALKSGDPNSIYAASDALKEAQDIYKNFQQKGPEPTGIFLDSQGPEAPKVPFNTGNAQEYFKYVDKASQANQANNKAINDSSQSTNKLANQAQNYSDIKVGDTSVNFKADTTGLSSVDIKPVNVPVDFKPASGEIIPPNIKSPNVPVNFEPASKEVLPPNIKAPNVPVNFKPATQEVLPPSIKSPTVPVNFKPATNEVLPPDIKSPNVPVNFKPATNEIIPPNIKSPTIPVKFEVDSGATGGLNTAVTNLSNSATNASGSFNKIGTSANSAAQGISGASTATQNLSNSATSASGNFQSISTAAGSASQSINAASTSSANLSNSSSSANAGFQSLSTSAASTSTSINTASTATGNLANSATIASTSTQQLSGSAAQTSYSMSTASTATQGLANSAATAGQSVQQVSGSAAAASYSMSTANTATQGLAGSASQAASSVGSISGSAGQASSSLNQAANASGNLSSSTNKAANSSATLTNTVSELPKTYSQIEKAEPQTPLEKAATSANSFGEALIQAAAAVNTIAQNIENLENLSPTITVNVQGLTGLFTGGPTKAGQTYRVNELGREAFLSSSGKLSMIQKPKNSLWKAPSSGTVIPAHLTKMLEMPATKVNIGSATAKKVARMSGSNRKSADIANVISRAIASLDIGASNRFAATAQASQAVQLGKLTHAVNELTEKNWNVNVNVKTPGQASFSNYVNKML